MKEIEKTLTSVERTLDILKKRLSENSEKLEKSEVYAAVQEKMFRKTLAGLDKQETLTNRGKTELFSTDDKETVKALEKKTKVLVKMPQEVTLPMTNNDQLQTIKKETDNIVKVKKTEVMKKPKELTELEGLKGLRKQDESEQLKGLRETYNTTETIQLNKMEESIEVGNDFPVSNVTFEKYGSSSIIALHITKR